jgi:choline dehydrogenase-like flavoprotein
MVGSVAGGVRLPGGRGGTAGGIVAAQLAQEPAISVGLIEWGPSDEHEPRARSIRRWPEMLEGEELGAAGWDAVPYRG